MRIHTTTGHVFTKHFLSFMGLFNVSLLVIDNGAEFHILDASHLNDFHIKSLNSDSITCYGKHLRRECESRNTEWIEILLIIVHL